MPYDPLGSQPFEIYRAGDMYDSSVASTSAYVPAPAQTASDWSLPAGLPSWQRGPQAMPEQAAAGLTSPPSAHGGLPNGLPNMFLSGALAAQSGALQMRSLAPAPGQPTDALRLPNLSPTSLMPPPLQYPQQPYSPLNFLASGYLPAPFISNTQINAPSFVYSAPPPTSGFASPAGTSEAPRTRPFLAPINTRPLAQGLPVPHPAGEAVVPSPRRRSNPSDTSPQLSDTSPTTGDSGNEERIDSPTPFINKLHFLLSNPEYDCIRWTADGRSFVFASSSPELITAFAQVFRHRNTNSFVRQLNIYNFKRLSGVELHDALTNGGTTPCSTGDYTGFTHPLFFRDSPGHRCDLGKIKPTKGKHYSAARRSSASSAASGIGAGAGASKAHVLRGKGKVGGAVPAEEAERKYSISG
ncbi:hypothetical protein JCM10908_004088 [Rhodotorula pacifica]|uniref:uncharacterized protein n=1 Tax=Rhodotorula pacifica TaxID=1495444 RepID=UPI00316F3691